MHIPSNRVILPDDAAVPDTVALGQDLHVASVHMPWMSCVQVVVQVDADRAVRSEIKDLPILRERQVALRYLIGDRQVVIAVESAVVQFPNEVTSAVLDEIDEDVGDDTGCLDHHRGGRCELLGKKVVVTRLNPRLVVGFVGLGCRCERGVCAVIENCSHDVGIGRTSAASTIGDGTAHPHGSVGGQVCRHDDVGTLPDTECENVGDEWRNRDEVLGDDREVVLVNGELLHAFRAPIDDSHAVSLSCDELEG